MTDTGHDAAMRWLARNVAWSIRIEQHRTAPRRRAALVALAGPDRHEHRDDRRRDRCRVSGFARDATSHRPIAP